MYGMCVSVDALLNIRGQLLVLGTLSTVGLRKQTQAVLSH